MTNNDSDDAAEFMKALQARVSRPMPVQAQRELAACVGIDQLGQSLDDALAAFDTHLSATEAMSAEVASAAIMACWKTSLAALKAEFDRVDGHGRTLILSIKIMLALE